MKRFLSVLMIGTLWLATALARRYSESGFSNLQFGSEKLIPFKFKKSNFKEGQYKVLPGPRSIGPVGKRGIRARILVNMLAFIAMKHRHLL